MDHDFCKKDVSKFYQLAKAVFELPFHAQKSFITNNEDFFICSAGATPEIKLSDYKLRVRGNGVRRELALSYDDLKSMNQTTVPAFLECAGNHRKLFEWVLSEKLDKRPDVAEVMWTLGGVGMAEWRGVQLRDLLALADVDLDAVHVCPIGLDDTPEGNVMCPMPLAKAIDPHTIIALEMNGVPLPPDHGFPARVIVPGWVGTYSIKWVGEILVSLEHLWVRRNTEWYVLMGDEWDPRNYSPANGAPITEQSLKSSLALPWPARLVPGKHQIRGYARSPNSQVKRVEWSADEGITWHDAVVASSPIFAWTPFSFEWDIPPGTHTIMTKATDESGRTQPDKMPFNHGGYLFNMVHRHPVYAAKTT